jgi:ABC-type phosphate transport system substrate-binding protein
MKTILERTACAFAVMMFSVVAFAEVKVVVHPSVKDASITAAQAQDVFLGKASGLPSGHKTVPVDQGDGQPARDEFYRLATKKDAAQLKAYWSRLIFTGKGQPPKVLTDDAEVLQLVANNPNIVGYVSGNANTSKVKVLLTLP